MSAESRISVSH